MNKHFRTWVRDHAPLLISAALLFAAVAVLIAINIART